MGVHAGFIKLFVLVDDDDDESDDNGDIVVVEEETDEGDVDAEDEGAA